MEPVLFQRVAFPFGKRVYDFDRTVILLFYSESDRTLHSVQIVVQAGFRRHEKGSGYAEQIETFRQRLLKEIFDSLDRDLRVIKGQIGMVIFRYV